MNRKLSLDTNKVNELLENPDLEKESQDVHYFLESIIGQKFDQSNLTSKNIKTWDKKYVEALGIFL